MYTNQMIVLRAQKSRRKFTNQSDVKCPSETATFSLTKLNPVLLVYFVSQLVHLCILRWVRFPHYLCLAGTSTFHFQIFSLPQTSTDTSHLLTHQLVCAWCLGRVKYRKCIRIKKCLFLLLQNCQISSNSNCIQFFSLKSQFCHRFVHIFNILRRNGKH